MSKLKVDCKDKDPVERAAYLETWADLEAVHSRVAQEGQSEVRPYSKPVKFRLI